MAVKTPRIMHRRRDELAIAWVSTAIAVNAMGGAWYGLRGAPAVPLEWLRGTPFTDYRMPSVALGVGVGGTCALAAVTAWRGRRRAPATAILAGGVLSAWIVARVATIGLRSPLQPAMAAAGAVLIGLGRRLA